MGKHEYKWLHNIADNKHGGILTISQKGSYECENYIYEKGYLVIEGKWRVKIS